MKLLPWIILLLAIVFFKYKDEKIETSNTETIISTGTYEIVPILTGHELRNYKVLKEFTDVNGYSIHVKVRLADIINPKKNQARKDWYRKFMKITSKHVDFVLCDSNMNVSLIIELDDWSHERQDRKDRDQFVNTALTDAGLRVLHTPEINKECIDMIDSILNPSEPKLEREQPSYEEWKAKKIQDQIISPTGWIYNKETKLWDPPKNEK